MTGALKFYVGAGYRKGDGGYARRGFLAESRLLTAVEKSPDAARQLVLRKKEGTSFRLLSGKRGDWSDFLALVRRAPVYYQKIKVIFSFRKEEENVLRSDIGSVRFPVCSSAEMVSTAASLSKPSMMR